LYKRQGRKEANSLFFSEKQKALRANIRDWLRGWLLLLAERSEVEETGSFSPISLFPRPFSLAFGAYGSYIVFAVSPRQQQ
jgi:hypothetical protein